MAEQPAENLWSIIVCGSKYFLANIIHSDGAFVTAKPCYEVTAQLMPVGRREDGTPIVSKNISAEPILVCFGCPAARLRPDVLVHYDDMKEGDRARYKRLADSADKMCQEAIMAESGIVSPGGGRIG